MPYHTHGLYPTFALHTGDSVVVLVQHIPVALWRTVTIMLKLLDFSCHTVSLSSLGLTHSTPYRSPLKQQLNFWSISRQMFHWNMWYFYAFLILHSSSSIQVHLLKQTPTGLQVTLAQLFPRCLSELPEPYFPSDKFPTWGERAVELKIGCCSNNKNPRWRWGLRYRCVCMLKYVSYMHLHVSIWYYMCIYIYTYPS